MLLLAIVWGLLAQAYLCIIVHIGNESKKPSSILEGIKALCLPILLYRSFRNMSLTK